MSSRYQVSYLNFFTHTHQRQSIHPSTYKGKLPVISLFNEPLYICLYSSLPQFIFASISVIIPVFVLASTSTSSSLRQVYRSLTLLFLLCIDGFSLKNQFTVFQTSHMNAKTNFTCKLSFLVVMNDGGMNSRNVYIRY